MKRLAFLTSILLVALIILSDGCKKEKDKVLNKITISGNTNTAINRDYIPETGEYAAAWLTGCNTTMYQSSFNVKFTNMANIQFDLYNPTTSSSIHSGTFQSQEGTECAPGFIGWFTPYLIKGEGITLTEGSVTVTITGKIYNVDIDIIIEAKDGGGKLTGNFNGEMSQINNR
jgi:hypothetical protein